MSGKTPSEIKLLPCPFCGSEAELMQHRAEGRVECLDCESSTQDFYTHFTFEGPWQAEATAAWNRRPAPAETDEEGTRLVQAIAHTALAYHRCRANELLDPVIDACGALLEYTGVGASSPEPDWRDKYPALFGKPATPPVECNIDPKRLAAFDQPVTQEVLDTPTGGYVPDRYEADLDRSLDEGIRELSLESDDAHKALRLVLDERDELLATVKQYDAEVPVEEAERDAAQTLLTECLEVLGNAARWIEELNSVNPSLAKAARNLLPRLRSHLKAPQ